MSELTIKVALKSMDFSVESRMVILGAGQFSIGGVKSLTCSAELKLFSIGEFAQFIGALLCLEEVVVDSLDASIVVLALTLLESNSISHSVDLVLILGFLLTESTKLKSEVVSILAESVGLVTLDSDLSLESYALLLTTADLITNGTNFSLKLIVSTILFIEKET